MTAPKRNAWMPFYVGDYLRKTSRLTLEQHGAYLLLILDCWTNGPPPDDDDALAAITRTSPAKWVRMRPMLEPFFKVADGRWLQPRVEEERTKTFAITELRRMAGKEGASKRWGKGKANGMANAMANGEQGRSQIDGPSQSHINSSSIQSGSARDRGPSPMSEAAKALLRQSLERVAGK
jgi:uncharacterized protein YdaU (DUF1376 family)